MKALVLAERMLTVENPWIDTCAGAVGMALIAACGFVAWGHAVLSAVLFLMGAFVTVVGFVRVLISLYHKAHRYHSVE